jgi:hypothetical protein
MTYHIPSQGFWQIYKIAVAVTQILLPLSGLGYILCLVKTRLFHFNFKRAACLLLLGVTALLLTGCIWLRLLELKNQLAEFDRFVKVDERQGLTLHFVKPVVLSQDIRQLSDVEPTAKATNQNHETWYWTFEKQFASTNAPELTNNLTLEMGFTKGKMDSVTFPERVLAFVPKPFIIGIFRSLGGAEIDQKTRSASMKWQGFDKNKFVPLTKAQMTNLLGAPFSITQTNLNSTYFYRYGLKTVTPVAVHNKRVRARFTFHQNSDQAYLVEADFAGLKFDINFDALTNSVRP